MCTVAPSGGPADPKQILSKANLMAAIFFSPLLDEQNYRTEIAKIVLLSDCEAEMENLLNLLKARRAVERQTAMLICGEQRCTSPPRKKRVIECPGEPHREEKFINKTQ